MLTSLQMIRYMDANHYRLIDSQARVQIRDKVWSLVCNRLWAKNQMLVRRSVHLWLQREPV